MVRSGTDGFKKDENWKELAKNRKWSILENQIKRARAHDDRINRN